MKVSDFNIDIEFTLSERAMGKLHRMRDPLWIARRLRTIHRVQGVGFNPESITLSINAEHLQQATEAMEKAESIINEQLI